jgi:hypothetical protein
MTQQKPITTSQYLDDIIKTYDSPDMAKAHWEDILSQLEKNTKRKCSRTLVNKRVRKLYAKGQWTPQGETPQLPPAQEPIIRIDQPEEKPILTEPETTKGEVLPEPKPMAKGEKPQGEKPAEGEVTDEERQQLKPILARSIKRTFGIVSEGLLKLSEDAGLSDQEADDSVVLLEVALSKWTGTSLGKYYFETTLVLHFGSIAGRSLLAWREKRDKDAKAQEIRDAEERQERQEQQKAREQQEQESQKKSREKPEEKPMLTKEKPFTGDKPKFLEGEHPTTEVNPT